MEFQYKEMGTRIKVRRKELKIKQAELAEALEISNNHMSSIENGSQVWIPLSVFADALMLRPIIFCLEQCTHITFHRIFQINYVYAISPI